MALTDKESQTDVTDYSKIDEKTIVKPGDYRLVSYEWGVTYAGMLLATEVNLKGQVEGTCVGIGKIINTLDNYPEAVRQTAIEEQVPLIDLNAMSKQFYEALGTENSKKAFVHYPANAYQGQDKPLADDTHFNPYGAYELAKCIVQHIRQNNPDLVRYLVDGLPVFDPAHPEDVNKFRWYESPSVNLLKPDGN